MAEISMGKCHGIVVSIELYKIEKTIIPSTFAEIVKATINGNILGENQFLASINRPIVTPAAPAPTNNRPATSIQY